MGLEEDAEAALRERAVAKHSESEKRRLAERVLSRDEYPQAVTELIHMLQRDRPEPTTLHAAVRGRTTMFGLGSPRLVYRPVARGWVLIGFSEEANLLGTAAITTDGIVYEGWSPTPTHGGLIGQEHKLAAGFGDTFRAWKRDYFAVVSDDRRLRAANNAPVWALDFAQGLLAHKAGRPLPYGAPGVF